MLHQGLLIWIVFSFLVGTMVLCHKTRRFLEGCGRGRLCLRTTGLLHSHHTVATSIISIDVLYYRILLLTETLGACLRIRGPEEG